MEQRKTRQRRVEILKSAAAAFRRRGYHGASMGEISRALRMTKGSLYYYFKNKEEILFFCHDYSLDILLDVLDRVEAAGGTPPQKLRSLIESFVHHILDDLRGTAMTLDFQALSAPLLRRVIAKRDRFDRGIRRLLQEGMDKRVHSHAGCPTAERARALLHVGRTSSSARERPREGDHAHP
jgi:AcrR family transcriptional regulator